MAQLLPLLSMYLGHKYPSYHIQIIDVVPMKPICHLSMSREQQKVTLSNPRGLNSPCFPATHHSPHKFVHVPPLLRDLPGDLVCPYRIVIGLLAKSKVVTQVDQGQGDAKPHAQQGHHGRERHLESQQEPQK